MTPPIPQTPHFYRPARASPAPPTPHFYRQGLEQPSLPKSLTFIDRAWASPAHLNPSLLSTGPGRPDTSLLLARPITSISQVDGITPAGVTPRATGAGPP